MYLSFYIYFYLITVMHIKKKKKQTVCEYQEFKA